MCRQPIPSRVAPDSIGTKRTRSRSGNGTGVTPEEAEDVFFHEPIVVRSEARHSQGEKRFYALGRTSRERRLFVAFTIRRKQIRVISARDMNRNETAIYAKHERNLKFKSEEEEQRFWAEADSTEYVAWESGTRKKFVQLKPSWRTISLRLPVSMIEDLKVLALNRRDVPYQSLLKVFLAGTSRSRTALLTHSVPPQP